MRKFYTVYKIDKENNDIINIMDYDTPEELAKDYKLKNIKSIYHYIIKSLDNINLLEIKNLLDCKYIIMIQED